MLIFNCFLARPYNRTLKIVSNDALLGVRSGTFWSDPVNRTWIYDINTVSKKGLKSMRKKIAFTPEQKAAIASNPFTLSVSDYQIRFTIDFKKFLLEERARNNTKWKEIIRKAGYDPEVFGKARIDHLAKTIKTEAASPQGLHETASRKNLAKASEHQQLRTTVRDLQQEVTRLQQQIEFLKKTEAVFRSTDNNE